MLRKIVIAAAVIIAAGVAPAAAQNTIAITGAKVLTVSHGVIENGTVLVENGKIAAVGANVTVPTGAQVIDAHGKVVTPGLIDAGDALGLVEIPAEQITVDSTEYTDPLHPELRVLDALNPRSELLKVTRAEGITNALSEPATGNLIAGQSAVIQLDGETVEQMVVRSPAALHINLGEESKLVYGPKGKPPETRMGQMAMLRQEFLKAQHYKAEHEAYAKRQSEKKSQKKNDDSAPADEERRIGPPPRDLKMDALVAAMEAKIPVVVHADRVSDLEMALRLADEFHLRLILADAAAAWRLADQLATRKIPVIVGPILEEPERMESIDVRLDNAARLYRAGVPIAIQTATSNDVRNLPFEVEYAIGYGLPEPAALEAVTINPARFFGVDDRLGSIDPGKDANLLVLDGMPFHVKTHVVTELIDGRVVDLSNHQTELFKFYKANYGIN
ncbi:MAG TPA: amidohydrolase family protein [Terriglobia bacterium]|nr:amidohydrolase family protein [Terriglobia bacterium]